MPEFDLSFANNLRFVELFAHFSYVLVACSFLVRDILYLRALAILASISLVAYAFYGGEQPNWTVLGWQAVFFAINTVWVVALVRERQGVRFTDEERELFETVFRAFAPVEFMKLMRLAQWRTVRRGETLAKTGDVLPELKLIYNGEAVVRTPTGEERRLKDGAFVGEMSFVRGGAASADVKAASEMRIVTWAKEDLRGLLRRNPSMLSAMQTVVSEDLTKKLLAEPAG